MDPCGYTISSLLKDSSNPLSSVPAPYPNESGLKVTGCELLKMASWISRLSTPSVIRTSLGCMYRWWTVLTTASEFTTIPNSSRM